MPNVITAISSNNKYFSGIRLNDKIFLSFLDLKGKKLKSANDDM